MQIKTAPRFHLAPVRIAKIKGNNNKWSDDVVKKECLYTAGGDVN
jgi:hypothetical protein